jgi:hypothetical protein
MTGDRLLRRSFLVSAFLAFATPARSADLADPLAPLATNGATRLAAKTCDMLRR